MGASSASRPKFAVAGRFLLPVRQLRLRAAFDLDGRSIGKGPSGAVGSFFLVVQLGQRRGQAGNACADVRQEIRCHAHFCNLSISLWTQA